MNRSWASTVVLAHFVNLQQKEAEGSCASEGAGWRWDAVFECLESESSIKVQAHASYQCWSLMIDCATLPSNTMTSHARRTFRFLSKFQKLIIAPTPHQHHILALSEHCVPMNIAAVRKWILVTWLLLISVATTTAVESSPG